MEFGLRLENRKSRFLAGLHCILASDFRDYGRRDLVIGEVVKRNRFIQDVAKIYGLEFTMEDMLRIEGMTTGKFTDEYCPKIYSDRHMDFESLVRNSLNEHGAIVLSELDRSFKYGLNGSEWCDVAEGPCSCGGWH